MIGSNDKPVLILFVFAAIVLIGLVFLGWLMRYWVRAFMACAPLRLVDLIGMRLRKQDVNKIVACHIQSVQAGMAVPLRDLESHALAGGDIQRMVTAAIAARMGGLHADWATLAAMDLAGKDVLAYVAAHTKDETPAPQPPSPAASAEPSADEESGTLLGASGTTETYIPTAGYVLVNGRRLPAVAQTGPLERGMPVEVVAVTEYAVVRPK